jgi:hypothetical protein
MLSKRKSNEKLLDSFRQREIKRRAPRKPKSQRAKKRAKRKSSQIIPGIRTYKTFGRSKREAYFKYLLSDTWKEVRRLVFARFGKVCNRCEKTKCLQLHHIHYGNLFNERWDDLEILCGKCHAEHHSKDPKS